MGHRAFVREPLAARVVLVRLVGDIYAVLGGHMRHKVAMGRVGAVNREHRNSRTPVCRRCWAVSTSLRQNTLRHNGHRCGGLSASRSCYLACAAMLSLRENVSEQLGQAYRGELVCLCSTSKAHIVNYATRRTRTAARAQSGSISWESSFRTIAHGIHPKCSVNFRKIPNNFFLSSIRCLKQILKSPH